LFDACPSRATSDGLAGPDGQALDKAPGRKPRNEARPFSLGAALWAFERRLIAQVRDVHGGAPGAASWVKPLPAVGGVGEVRAARLVMRMPVAGAAGLDQACPNGCWRKDGGAETMPGHECHRPAHWSQLMIGTMEPPRDRHIEASP